MTATATAPTRRPDAPSLIQATAGAAPDACAADCCAPAASPIGEEEAARSAGVLRALADPNRLRMLALIAAQPPDSPLCACDVEAGFSLSQSTISHHLKVLREAGLISVTKRGLWHYYAPRPEGLAPLRGLLEVLGEVPAAPSATAGATGGG
jgi:ArsR family transcriptional regulator